MQKNDLAGLTVVDISQNLPGPYCAYLLEKAGAVVIKVESPKKPDPAKFIPPFYEILNKRKSELSLDLTNESDLTEFYRLTAGADIVIEGARPGVAKKLKVDFDTLIQYSPKLIYCSISGYGQDSINRNRPAHDINLQAETGLLGKFGDVKTSVSAIPIADLTASYGAYSEILSKLYNRKSGCVEPQYIDIAMNTVLQDMVNIWGATVPTKEMINAEIAKNPLANALSKVKPINKWLHSCLSKEPLSTLPHYGVFKCKDKTWIALGIVDEQHFWISMCDSFGGFFFNRLKHTKLKQRVLLSWAIRGLIKRKILSQPSEYWLDVLAGLPISRVNFGG